MRSIKLRPALAAAALSLALAPSAALAAKHSKPNAHRHASPAGCHLTIFAEPRVVTLKGIEGEHLVYPLEWEGFDGDD